MNEKKIGKSSPAKAKSGQSKTKSSPAKAKSGQSKTKSSPAKAKSKGKKSKQSQSYDDMGIVIVDDDIVVDQEKVNEERRAYLEESRSQDAYD